MQSSMCALQQRKMWKPVESCGIVVLRYVVVSLFLRCQRRKGVANIIYRSRTMFKNASICILSLQISILLMYFTSLLAIIELPIYLVLSIWFIIGIAGFVNAIVLFVKKKLLNYQ